MDSPRTNALFGYMEVVLKKCGKSASDAARLENDKASLFPRQI
jgi:hypothetical protein